MNSRLADRLKHKYRRENLKQGMEQEGEKMETKKKPVKNIVLAEAVGEAVLALVLWFFGIPFIMQIPLYVFVAVGIFRMERQKERERKKKTEYEEAAAYMEQLLCSYKRLGHLGRAWEDCLPLCEQGGTMWHLIRRAQELLKSGEDSTDSGYADNSGEHRYMDGSGESGASVAWSACREIHTHISSRHMILIHEFLCRTEQTGGEITEALDILLQELQMWKRRNALFHTRRLWFGRECRIAVCLAVVLCFFSEFVMPADIRAILYGTVWYKGVTAAVLALLAGLFLFLDQRLSSDWLDHDTDPQSRWKKQRQMYELVTRKKGGLRAGAAKKYCRQEVEREFPYWLLTVALYLQHETVYPALMDSVERTGGIFRTEVERLITGIYESPASPEPYYRFFEPLDLEEIRSGMRILYAAGNSEYGDISRQIRFLVELNNMIMDRYEQKKYESEMAGMGIWRQLPMLAGAGKVLFDMAVVLLAVLQQYAFF